MKIFCICGYSASGKDSLTNRVSKELNIPTLVSHTSRPMREGEKEGLSYYFTDNRFFEKHEDEFIEQRKYETTHGLWRYGLHKSELDNITNGLFIVDRQGYEEMCNKLGEENVISIFIEVPEKELRHRQVIRGDDVKEFNRRYKDDIKRFKGFISDYIVYNGNFETALQELKCIISDEMEAN